MNYAAAAVWADFLTPKTGRVGRGDGRAVGAHPPARRCVHQGLGTAHDLCQHHTDVAIDRSGHHGGAGTGRNAQDKNRLWRQLCVSILADHCRWPSHSACASVWC